MGLEEIVICLGEWRWRDGLDGGVCVRGVGMWGCFFFFFFLFGFFFSFPVCRVVVGVWRLGHEIGKMIFWSFVWVVLWGVYGVVVFFVG